ncbi:MAG TPA: DUF4157 domain-containing protein, partial [Allocoleopsis sp.]
MSTQAHDSSKAASNATATPRSSQFETRPFEQASVNSAFAPVTNQFQSRPFAAPSPQSPSQQAAPDIQAQLEQAKHFNYDLSEINLFSTGTTPPEPPPSPVIQPKLTIGEPGDKYEQEADSVAAQVMSMSAAPTQSKSIQRQGDEDEQEPLVQRTPLADSITPLVLRQIEEQEEPIQTKSLLQRAVANGNAKAGGNLESQLSSSKGGGSPLPDEVRSFMEPRFGTDFSQVRVHTDSTAIQMNKELSAQAFAHGRDIYYGAGKSPGNNELTAHELTHTIQQTGGIVQRHLQESELVSAPSSAPAHMLSRAPSTDTPSQAKSQFTLPAGVNYDWVGGGLDFYVLLRRSWLKDQGVSDDATETDKKEILTTVTPGLKKVAKWVQDEDIAAIMKEQPVIYFGGKLKDKDEILGGRLQNELVGLIGAPEGQEVTVSIRQEGAAIRLDKRLILRYAQSGNDQFLKSKDFNEILFSNIEAATGLTLEDRAGVINSYKLEFDKPVKDLFKAYVLTVEDGYFIAWFGDAWTEFRQTPREVAGEAQGQSISLPASIGEKERQKILDVLNQLIPPTDKKDPKQSRPGSLALSAREAQLLLQIADSPNREQILKLMKEGKKSGGATQTLEQQLETAIASIDMQEAYKRLGIEPGKSSEERKPIENRPVRGNITQPDADIVPGKKVSFKFLVKEDRDALRVPWINIHWIAHPKDQDEDKEKKQSKKSSWVDDEHSHYSPIKDPGILNDMTFDVKFPQSGIYVIEAFVDHNFFLPAHFTTTVEIVTEKEKVDELEKKALKGFVKAGSGETKEHSFDVGAVTGAVTDYEKGSITYGEIDPNFKGATVTERLKAIDDEVKRINTLLKKYQASQTSEAKAVVEWAQKYLKKLTEGRTTIALEATTPGTSSLACQGVYVSRTQGVPSKTLDLLSHINKTEDGKYKVVIHDISQVYENANYRVEESADTSESAMEKAFVSHAANYPEGTLSLTFQKWDDTQQKLTGQYVKFSKVTDTLGKDIKGVLFSAPVDIAVNIVGTLLTLFPPTTAVGMTVMIGYNGAKTIAGLEESYAKGTLTGKEVGYAAGTIALDLIPVVGKSSKVITLGRKAFYAIEATQLAGQAFLITSQGLDEVQKLREGVITNLAKIEAQIEELENNPADPQLKELRQEREKLIKEGREATVKVFSALAAQQAVIMVGGAILQEMATRKFKVAVDELKQNGLFEHEEGKKLHYDYEKKKIVGDEKSFTPAQLEKVQKTAYYDGKLAEVLPNDPVSRKKIVEILGDREVEIRPGGKKTRLEQEGDKWVLHVAEDAKPGDILAEAYRTKTNTAVLPVEPGKVRSPIEQANYHQNELTHLEDIRKRASKDTGLDDFEIETRIRGQFMEMERVVKGLPEGTKEKAKLQKWLDKYRKQTYEPATKLFDRLKKAKSDFPSRYSQFKPENRAKIRGMKDEGLEAFARLAPDKQEKFIGLDKDITGKDIWQEFNKNNGSRQAELLKDVDGMLKAASADQPYT